MKKVLFLASALTLFNSLPANAEVNIIFSSPEPVLVAPVPTYIVESPVYPVHIEKHHHYDWNYWREHKEQEERREREEHRGHEEHEEHDHR